MIDSSTEPTFWNYWGKARRLHAQPDFHPLVYHSLDVAAVGLTYLERSPMLVEAFCSRLNCSSSAFLSWSSFFLAMHDLGKFADTFQLQRPDLVERLQGRKPQCRDYTVRHDSLGFWLWKDLVRGGLLGSIGVRGDAHDINYWVRAACGHHGLPPDDKVVGALHFKPADRLAACQFAEAAASLLLDDEAKLIPEIDSADFDEVSQELSWWFAGLTVLSDWLGSNVDYFAYQPERRCLEQYWADTRLAASKVLTASGVLPISIAAGKTLRDLFPYIEQPSPLQAWAETVELPRTPQIHLLEDVTGAGKTEAAIMLAYRLMAQGAASGFFVGLPTMATANAMYERLATQYQHLFATQASLALGHRYKEFVDLFAASILPASEGEHDEAQCDDTATARCTAWLADHNKRVLLSPAGVGTVDQALLAVLHSKHQSLRLLGLFNKVLIVDEVHACDAYMEGVLKVLLRFHARMGGSVVLLSATLPSNMKSRLLNAYASGRQAPHIGPFFNDPYPAATYWSEDNPTAQQYKLATRANVSRSLSVRYLSDDAQLYVEIRNALAAGKCVGWIRNTVADATEAYDVLAQYVDADKITLFHARFALGDRLRTERRILHHFGEGSDTKTRSGCLMIATQVAEQSLDLDFDVLISDLAPIDRILQRAGRLQRHVRDLDGNRLRHTGATDGRPATILLVYGPAWTLEPRPDWYAAKFGTAKYVYSRHDQLWLTSKVLQEGRFSMPEDARRLVESVYSGEAQVPASLQENAMDGEGKDRAEASQAQLNALTIETGYKRGEIPDWWADTQTPSRLGEEVKEVMLAKYVEGRLVPWFDEKWPYSMVKVSARHIASAELRGDVTYHSAYAQLVSTLPSQGKYCVLLPLEQQSNGIWEAEAWTSVDNAKGRPPRLLVWQYDVKLGLRIKGPDAGIPASD